MIYVLAIGIIIVLFFSYYLSAGDYMAPPFLLCAFFAISELSAIAMKNSWNISITIGTVVFIMIGIISFCLGYYFTWFNIKTNKIYRKVNYINIKTIYLIIYNISAVVILYFFVKALRSEFGNSNWTTLMEKYRFATVYADQTKKSIYMSSVIVDLKFIINNLSYLFGYILINNYVITNKWDFRLIISIAFGLISTLMGASRFDLIRIPIYIIFIYYLLRLRTNTLTHKKSMRLLVKYICIAFCFVIIFGVSSSFVGRTRNEGILYYIAHYLSTPTLNFNDYLKNPVESSTLIGKESFWGIYNFLYKLTKIDKYKYDYTLEFRQISGVGMGNVYTAFRMFYADFGIIGIVILSMLQGIIFALFYKLIKYDIKLKILKIHIFKKSLIEFRIIIYAMILHSVILMFFADWFYSQVLSWYQIKSFICIYILKLILVDFDKKNLQEEKYKNENNCF